MSQSEPGASVDGLIAALNRLPGHIVYGEVTGAVGLLIEIEGLPKDVCLGDHLRLRGRDGSRREAEVVGFRGGRILAMPFGATTGLACGARAEIAPGADVLFPTRSWLGRVIDA